MDELKRKVAIVTGASRGIGKATAELLGELGVAVTVASRSMASVLPVAESIEAAGGKALAMACDVADYQAVAAMVERSRDHFGKLDILVNNAGLIEPIARLAKSDPRAWKEAADTNYLGVYHGLRTALPEMLARGEGVIVNVSSGAAIGVLEGWSHYCSSKAAALALTRAADLEYRDQGIRVVGLSPGTVATDMQVAIKASGINPVSQLDPAVHIPAAWAARAIAWLCTEQGAPFAGMDFSLSNEKARELIGLPV